MAKAFYKVMLGRGSSAADEARVHGFIGADYRVQVDLSNQLPDKWQDFNEEWIPYFLAEGGKPNRVSAGLAAGQLWTVAKGIQVGDIVLSPTDTSSGELYVGVVTSEYHYRAGETLPHRRSVEWQPRKLARIECSAELRGGLGYGSTVCNLDRYGDEILKLTGIDVERDPIISRNPDIENASNFVMERHLEDFLVENWEQTALGAKFDIYSEDGEVVGQQYQTDTGPIDVLAISKDKKILLVVELKKGRASDSVVGQTLRYMGYVRELAEKGQEVRGAIIALEDDPRLRRAISMTPSIDFYRYEVQFKLHKS
jgi:restriction system protein